MCIEIKFATGAMLPQVTKTTPVYGMYEIYKSFLGIFFTISSMKFNADLKNLFLLSKIDPYVELPSCIFTNPVTALNNHVLI